MSPQRRGIAKSVAANEYVKSSQVVPVLSNWITTLCAVTFAAAIPIISSCGSVSDRKTGLAGCCRSPPLERVVSFSLSFSASLAALALRWSSIALAVSVPSPLRLSPSPPPSYPLAYGPLSFPHYTRASARSLPLSSEWPLTCTTRTPPFLRSFYRPY